MKYKYININKMSGLFNLISGVVLGVYLEQNYNLPKVKEAFLELKEYLEKIEKIDKKELNSFDDKSNKYK